MTNKIALDILTALHEQHEIHGINDLAALLRVCPRDVRRNVIILAARGLIKIVPGKRGRGHKTIIRDAGALEQIVEASS